MVKYSVGEGISKQFAHDLICLLYSFPLLQAEVTEPVCERIASCKEGTGVSFKQHRPFLLSDFFPYEVQCVARSSIHCSH